MQEIPIVLATNNAYALYAYVTVSSIMEFANCNILYSIYILTDQIKNHYKDMFTRLIHENFSVTIIDVNEYIEKRDYYTCLHFSKEMYYRLYIPLILPQYEKVLYMDCDMIACEDVSKLYSINISEYLVAAVKNPINNYNRNYIENTLNFNYYNYFNSGLLLINCKKFEDFHVREKCFKELENREKLLYPDQDTLNIVCENRTLILDGIWNFQQHHKNKTGEFQVLSEFEKEYSLSEKNFKIIHFSGGDKPWNIPSVPYGYIFWNYARKTEAYEEIIYSCLQNKIEQRSISTQQDMRTVLHDEIEQRSISIQQDMRTVLHNELLGTGLKRKIKIFIEICKRDGILKALKHTYHKFKCWLVKGDKL